MTIHINQYKLFFFFSWIVLYLIFPTWALPISVSARALVFCAFIIYFLVSAVIMNRWFNALDVNKPLIVRNTAWAMLFKDNLWLVFICIIAVVLNVHPISFPILILGDETIHLENGLWIYEHIDVSWHPFFRIVFWVIIGLLVFFRKNNLRRISDHFFGSASIASIKYLFIFLLMGFLGGYFMLLKDIVYLPSLIRYPPLSKFLYFGAYSAFGINHIYPRMVELSLYVLCSIYLYRTINLFYEKETALFGAAMYLFLPVTFFYAHLGELANGVIFFMVATSFYFIRFVKNGDERDLLIAAFLIGTGCLYKKLILLMYVICFIFLAFYKIKKRSFPSLKHFKALSVSLVPIMPWLMLTKLYSWRNYEFRLDNLTSLDGKIFTYFPLIASNLSEIIFSLFVLSVIYSCVYRRNVLTVFYGGLFIVFYFFIVSDMGALSPRFSMAFYPTIIVFISLLISRIVQSIKWKHAFSFCFIVMTAYLIIISALSPLNNRFLRIANMKLFYFPSEEAMKWVKDNVMDEEKILTVRIQSSDFYQKKYAINQDRIIDLRYSFKEISTPEKLLAFYKEQDLSYIMFPYNPEYVKQDINAGILDYLRNNSSGEFIEVAKFNRGDKFIYIYKRSSRFTL